MYSVAVNIRKQARSSETIDVIIEALKLQLRSGQVFTMQEVADRAGVSIGTVYHHFSSKDQLLAFAYARYLSTIMQEIDAGLAQGISLGDLLRKIYFGSIRDLMTYSNIKNFISCRGEGADEIWNDFYDQFSETLLKYAPQWFPELLSEHAKPLIRTKIVSVHEVWRAHLQVLNEMPAEHQEAFVETLVSLIDG